MPWERGEGIRASGKHPLFFKDCCSEDHWRIQDLPKGEVGADHGERTEREPKRDLGVEPPVRSRVHGAKPPEAKSFLYILYKKWPKVKDLSENLPPCLSRAAMTSPKFWSLGAGGPPGPPIAGSTVHHCRRPLL